MLDRIKYFKEVAQRYEGDELSTDELALKCRETCPKAWVKVRNNCKKVWDNEERKEIYDSNGKLSEVWMYRCTDNYDEVLFSLLYCKFEKTIYSIYKKVYNYVDEDDYLDAVEDSICQSIRHYQPIKSSFNTLCNSMINNYAINLINRNTTITRKRDPETKQIISKTVSYHPIPISLDAILDNPEDYNNHNIPYDKYEGYNLIENLKDKYKKKKDLMTWLILDTQLNQSEILERKEFHNIIDKYKKPNDKYFINLYAKLLQTKLYKIFGFTDSPNILAYYELKNSDIDISLKIKRFKRQIKQYYLDSVNKLKYELKDSIQMV